MMKLIVTPHNFTILSKNEMVRKVLYILLYLVKQCHLFDLYSLCSFCTPEKTIADANDKCRKVRIVIQFLKDRFSAISVS
jgi:hypothetical protein